MIGGIVDYLSGVSGARVNAPTQLGQSQTRLGGEQGFGNIAAQQGMLGNELVARAMGQRPSLAAAQAQTAANQVNERAQRQAMGARGINTLLARNLASRAAQDQSGLLAEQAAQAALAEQQQAGSLAAGTLGGMAGQQLQLAGMGQQDQMALLDADMAARLQNQATEQQEAARRGDFAGGVVKTVGSALAMSDPALKTDIRPAMFPELAAPDGNRAALDGVDPYLFRYKPEAAAAQGTDTAMRPGVMAPELAEDEVMGRTVENTELGQGIDVGRGLSAALAGLAGIDKRLRALEGRG